MKAFLVLVFVAYAVADPMPDYGWPQPSYAVAQPSYAVAQPSYVKQVVQAPLLQPTVIKSVAPAASSYSTFTQSHVSHPQVLKVAQPYAYSQPIVKVAQPYAYSQPVVKVAQPYAYAQPAVQYVQQPLVKQVVNPW